MKKLVLWLLLLALCLPFALADDAPQLVDRINSPKEHADFAFAQDAALVEIAFPQILDTDAALLRAGGETLMIDVASAKHAQRVIDMLNQLGVTSIDAVICTHPHYDHVQGLELLAEAIEIKEFRIAHDEETEHMTNALKVCENKNIPVTRYGDGTQWQLGGAVLDVWMKADPTWGLNDRSSVIRLQYGQRTMLFCADAEVKLQNHLAKVIPAELIDVDVIKYPHHGKHALQKAFMQAVKPAFAVITNNGGQRKTKYNLRLNKVPFAFTVPGYVYLTTDGTTWVADRLDMENPVTVTSRPDTRPDR